MRYRVVLLMGAQFEGLRDVAEMLELALREADLPVQLVVLPGALYALENGVQDILVGAHATPEIWDRVPPRTALGTLEGFAGTPSPIVYQTESLLNERQLVVPSWWRRQAMRAVTWDFSAMNAMLLHTKHVPLGYVKAFVRPLATQPFPDTDVLFYGAMNERRARLIPSLQSLGLRTQIIMGNLGAHLDATIARSKVVLFAHLKGPGLFDSTHILPLIHRGVCVLDERSCNGEGLMVCSSAPYEELPEAALGLVRGDRYIVQRAEDHVRLRQQAPFGATLLEALGLQQRERAQRPAVVSFESASAESP